MTDNVDAILMSLDNTDPDSGQEQITLMRAWLGGGTNTSILAVLKSLMNEPDLAKKHALLRAWRGSGRQDQEKVAGPTPHLVTVTMRELLAHPPEKPVEIIKDLLPAHLSGLASAPKVGKSWLAYQIAVAITLGGTVLDHSAAKGDVLYLALEDGEYRASERTKAVLQHLTGRDHLPLGAGELTLAFNASRGDALIEQVEVELQKRRDTLLVIIDTLQKVRPGSSGRRNQYELDVEDVGRILELTKRHPHIGILVVHHDTKASHQPGADFVDAFSGTSGLTGSMDTVMVLRRKRHEETGTLEISSKDIKEGRYNLAYSLDDPFWTIDPLGGMTDAMITAFKVLRDQGPMGPTALGDALSIGKSSAGEVGDRLINQGSVVKEQGIYRVRTAVHILPDLPNSPDSPDSPDVPDAVKRSARPVRPVGSERARTSTGRPRLVVVS